MRAKRRNDPARKSGSHNPQEEQAMREKYTHYGDPCIHCQTMHDNVETGPCTGTGEPIVLKYAVIRQAWQNPGSGCCIVRCLMSNGAIVDQAHHPSEHWVYSEYFKNAEILPPHEFRKLEEIRRSLLQDLWRNNPARQSGAYGHQGKRMMNEWRRTLEVGCLIISPMFIASALLTWIFS